MLLGNILVLETAGLDSTMTTLEWSFTVMAAKPHVMARLQQEVDSAFGLDGKITYHDRVKCPYVQAFLWEIWRCISILPVNLPRRTMEDTSVGGYLIPEDTQVLLNYWAINYDHKLWDEPDEFKPERFLSSDGTKFIRSENSIPFSFGKRSCPGESLGLLSNFLYLANFLQKYNIRLTLSPDIAMQPMISFTHQLKNRPMLYFEPRT